MTEGFDDGCIIVGREKGVDFWRRHNDGVRQQVEGKEVPKGNLWKFKPYTSYMGGMHTKDTKEYQCYGGGNTQLQRKEKTKQAIAKAIAHIDQINRCDVETYGFVQR